MSRLMRKEENRMGVDQILAVRTTVDGSGAMPQARAFRSGAPRQVSRH